jgi:hypothetical protein
MSTIIDEAEFKIETDGLKYYLYKKRKFFGFVWWHYIDWHYRNCLPELLARHTKKKLLGYFDAYGKRIED